MGQAIAVRTDYLAGEVRRFAKQAKDVAQARRLLAIAAVLDGASRTEAAKIGGMDRQTLRDWVIRFNEQGPDGLINIPSPGVPRHDRGGRPDPGGPWCGAVAGLHLIMRLHEEFGISVSDDTIYRVLKELGFSHVSARPKAYKQDPEAHLSASKANAAQLTAMNRFIATVATAGAPREAASCEGRHSEIFDQLRDEHQCEPLTSNAVRCPHP